jgi:hypothetical protein
MKALIQQPPKPHEKMKLGKPKGKTSKGPSKQKAR